MAHTAKQARTLETLIARFENENKAALGSAMAYPNPQNANRCFLEGKAAAFRYAADALRQAVA